MDPHAHFIQNWSIWQGEMEGADLRVFLGIVERFKKSCLITFRQNQAGLGLAQGQNKGFFPPPLAGWGPQSSSRSVA